MRSRVSETDQQNAPQTSDDSMKGVVDGFLKDKKDKAD